MSTTTDMSFWIGISVWASLAVGVFLIAIVCLCYWLKLRHPVIDQYALNSARRTTRIRRGRRRRRREGGDGERSRNQPILLDVRHSRTESRSRTRSSSRCHRDGAASNRRRTKSRSRGGGQRSRPRPTVLPLNETHQKDDESYETLSHSLDATDSSYSTLDNDYEIPIN